MTELGPFSDAKRFVQDETLKQFDEALPQAEVYHLDASGSNVEAVLLRNPDSEGRLLTTYAPWKTGILTGEGDDGSARPLDAMGRYEGAAITYAAFKQGYDVLSVNHAGIGASSPLPSASQEAAKTGSFLPFAETYAKALESLYRDYDQRIEHGFSLGGRVAIAMGACATNGEVSVVADDPPGGRRLGYIGLLRAFVGQEGGNAKHIKESLKEVEEAREVLKAQGERDGAGFARLLGRAVLKGDLINKVYREVAAMASDALPNDVLDAVQKGPVQQLVLIRPEQSALSELEAFTDIAERDDRISVLTRPGNHSTYVGQPGYLGEVVHQSIKYIK